MKKIISCFMLSFSAIFAFGQTSYNASIQESFLDENAIVSFFSSDAFGFIMVAIMAAVLLMWVLYMFSAFQMDSSSAKVHRASPSEAHPRGIMLWSRENSRLAMQTIPVEKKEESPKAPERFSDKERNKTEKPR